MKHLSILLYCAFTYVSSEKFSHIHLNVHDHSSLWGVRGSNEHDKSKDISTYAAIKLTGPVIYTRSNSNRDFTQVVGLRDSV